MKKTTLMIMGMACTLGANAMATELSPYAALRLGMARVQNDATVSSEYSYSGKTIYKNQIADTDHTDNVFGAHAAFGIGADFAEYGAVRGELELNWNSDAKDNNNFDFAIKNKYTHKYETKTSVYGAMANLYYDMYTGTKFTPFVGGGIGWAHIKTSSTATGTVAEGMAMNISGDVSDNNFAWNVGAGISYALNDHIAFDISYRYSDFGSIDESAKISAPGLDALVNIDSKFDITSHEVMIGARYAF